MEFDLSSVDGVAEAVFRQVLSRREAIDLLDRAGFTGPSALLDDLLCTRRDLMQVMNGVN